jgi:hypothetical protein
MLKGNDRSLLEISLSLEGLHDFQGGKGVIGGIEKLPPVEFGSGPIAGGDGFGLRKV